MTDLPETDTNLSSEENTPSSDTATAASAKKESPLTFLFDLLEVTVFAVCASRRRNLTRG